jgi:hypothetical protein
MAQNGSRDPIGVGRVVSDLLLMPFPVLLQLSLSCPGPRCSTLAEPDRPTRAPGPDREHLEDQIEVDDGEANVSAHELASKPSRDRALAAGNRPGDHDHHETEAHVGAGS